MSNHIRNFWSIFLYAIAVFIVAGSNFISAPLLLKLLGVNGFAEWSRVEPLILMALPIAGLGVNFGILNLIRKTPDLGGRLLPIHLSIAFVISFSIYLISINFFDSIIALAVGIIVFVEGGIVFLIGFWRANNKPGMYASIEGGRSASVMLALLFMTFLPFIAIANVQEYLMLRAGIGIFFLALGLIITRWRWQPDFTLARSAIRFGLPIVLSSMTVSIIMNFDRYIVDYSSDAYELTQYTTHTKTIQILGSALAPFFTWFAPIAISRLQTGNLYDGFFGKSFYAFITLNFAFALGLWLVAPVFWQQLFPSVSYSPPLMAALTIGMVIFVAGNPLSVSSLREGRTSNVLMVTLMAIALGGTACVFMANAFGAIGVAWAKTLALTAYTSVFAILTWRSLRISYPWGRIAILAVTSFLAAFILGPIVLHQPPWIALGIASTASLTLLVIAFGLSLGIKK